MRVVIAGHGLDEALRGTEVVVDVTDASAHTEEAGLPFFRTATANLLATAASADVEHHVVLAVVGAERLRSGYFLAKELQEYQVQKPPIPHSIVRAAVSFASLDAMAVADTRPRRACADPSRGAGRHRCRCRACRCRSAAVRHAGGGRPRGVPP